MFPYTNYLIVQTNFAKLFKKNPLICTMRYVIIQCLWVRRGWEMPFQSDQEGLLNDRNGASTGQEGNDDLLPHFGL